MGRTRADPHTTPLAVTDVFTATPSSTRLRLAAAANRQPACLLALLRAWQQPATKNRGGLGETDGRDSEAGHADDATTGTETAGGADHKATHHTRRGRSNECVLMAAIKTP